MSDLFGNASWNSRAAGDLSSAVAIVTGASRGLGKAIALALGQAGATVYVTARAGGEGQSAGSRLEETVSEIARLGGRGIAVACDQAEDSQIEALVQKVDEERGRLDILVNNAFPVPDLQPTLGQKFWEVSTDIWQPVIDVGLRSHYVCSVKAMPLLLGSRGLIINISSAAGQIYYGSVVYGIGKGGMDRMVRDMAIELAGTAVTAVSLWPGIVRTELIKDELANGASGLLRHLVMLATAHFDDDDRQAALHPSHLQDATESSVFVGRAVVALATDREVGAKTGRALAVSLLADEYGFTDVDGRRPDGFRFHETRYWPQLYAN